MGADFGDIDGVWLLNHDTKLLIHCLISSIVMVSIKIDKSIIERS